MDQAQCAQWLDQHQFAPVEFAELLVTIDQRTELALALLPVTGEQHPHVLYRRPGTCIVQIDKMRTRTGDSRNIGRSPQDVARMAIAMQTQQPDRLLTPARRPPGQAIMARHHVQRLA